MNRTPGTMIGMAACRPLLIGALTAALTLPLAVSAAAFQPHRAVYDLALEKAEDRSGITGLSGKMVYEVKGSACDGYTVEFRLITEMTAANGVTQLTDVRTSSFEEGDGDGFHFLTQTFRNRTLSQESRGDASRSESDLEVVLKKPSAKTLRFDEKVLFPSQHFIEIIRRAEAGETFYTENVYDGSDDGETYFQTTTVIGQPRPLSIAEKGGAAKPETHWPVVIAYYDPRQSNTDATPVYTLSFLTNAPGVSRELKMDYDSFAIAGTLADLELFKPAACE